MTDHRIGFTSNGIDRFMNGENLEHVIDRLNENDEATRLNEFLSSIESHR